MVSVTGLTNNRDLRIVDDSEFTTSWFAKDLVALLALDQRLSVGKGGLLDLTNGAINFNVVRVWGRDGSSEFMSSLLEVLWQVK
jgi:hypothetical protein